MENNVIVAKLDHGTDIFKDIEEILKEKGKESAVVVSGIGMLTDLKLGYYDIETGEYSWGEFDEPVELVSLNGTISDEGTIHLHASIGGEDHRLKGGHLGSGTVFNVVELVVLVFDDIRLSRALDEERGSKLLTVR